MADSTYNSVSLGALQLQAGDDTPRLVQKNHFAGVGGTTVLDHGKRERQLVFIAHITGSSITNVDSKQSLIEDEQNQVKSLVHAKGGTTKTYTYCRLDNVQRQGNYGIQGSTYSCRLRLTFTQLVW